MVDYSKKYLNKLKVIDNNEHLTFYERQKLVRDLNKLVEDLKEKQEDSKKELDELTAPEVNFNPMKMKYLVPTSLALLGVSVASGLLHNLYPDVSGYYTTNIISTIIFANTIPYTFLAGMVELTEKYLIKTETRRFNSLELQKRKIAWLQKNYKDFKTGSDETLTFINEDEFLRGR